MATDSDTTARTTHILALMKQGDDAFNRRDKDGMDAAHHPEMVAHITGTAEPIHGRVAHAAAMDAMFQAFPDVHVVNDPYPLQFGQGDWMTVVTKATGTFSGEMALPDGTVIPGTGKSLSSTSPRRRDGRATSSSRSTCSGTQRSWLSRSGSHSTRDSAPGGQRERAFDRREQDRGVRGLVDRRRRVLRKHADVGATDLPALSMACQLVGVADSTGLKTRPLISPFPSTVSEAVSRGGPPTLDLMVYPAPARDWPAG